RRSALPRRPARRQFQLRAPQALRPGAGTGALRRVLHGGPPCVAEHADRGAQAQPYRHLVRAVHAAVRAEPGDRAAGAGGDRVDHLRRTVPRGAALRLARPSEPGARRSEHRDHLQSRRRAQFRPHRTARPCPALCPRPRVLRRGHG
ncbi:hypothetical protein OY671_012865, partial [Metschnikowia pulcherrima]